MNRNIEKCFICEDENKIETSVIFYDISNEESVIKGVCSECKPYLAAELADRPASEDFKNTTVVFLLKNGKKNG